MTIDPKGAFNKAGYCLRDSYSWLLHTIYTPFPAKSFSPSLLPSCPNEVTKHKWSLCTCERLIADTFQLIFYRFQLWLLYQVRWREREPTTIIYNDFVSYNFHFLFESPNRCFWKLHVKQKCLHLTLHFIHSLCSAGPLSSLERQVQFRSHTNYTVLAINILLSSKLLTLIMLKKALWNVSNACLWFDCNI